jgi:hypothetical protein
VRRFRRRRSASARLGAAFALYTLDLTRLRTPGLYTISFAGRRSPALPVAGVAAMYGPLSSGSVAFLQAQRDGPEVIPGPLPRALPSA